MDKKKCVTALEKDIEKKLKNEISRVINRIQELELESDIFGFGGKYRRTVMLPFLF
ncbi:Ger(x)C family spore germination C-terminal domain-containing protein [Lysinibacillus fusiformis]|uniref:Ger(x)C family spore germination C-terminal domain-containing protein n=1 Tax=Lysinibacillus fusiformis TaxID=28031 RepID=UPI0037BDF638